MQNGKWRGCRVSNFQVPIKTANKNCRPQDAGWGDLETAVASLMGTTVKRSFQDPIKQPVDPFNPCKKWSQQYAITLRFKNHCRKNPTPNSKQELQSGDRGNAPMARAPFPVWHGKVSVSSATKGRKSKNQFFPEPLKLRSYKVWSVHMHKGLQEEEWKWRLNNGGVWTMLYGIPYGLICLSFERRYLVVVEL